MNVTEPPDDYSFGQIWVKDDDQEPRPYYTDSDGKDWDILDLIKEHKKNKQWFKDYGSLLAVHNIGGFSFDNR